MGPILTLFNFTIRQTLLNRKIWLVVLALSTPCAFIVLIRSVADPAPQGESLGEFYHIVVQFLLLMGLIPLICMVHGTALIGADVEARTIIYLTTRRLHRATALLVEFTATALVLALLCDLGMIAFHVCTLYGHDASLMDDWDAARDLTCYLLTLPPAVFGFLAIFTLTGLLTAKPLALSVFYLVTFEFIISNLPVGVRVYSLLHQVRATMVGLMPRIAEWFRLPHELRDRLYPEDGTGLPELLGIVVLALFFSSILITIRELIPTKVSRD